ncbi:MAG: hypothetical protein R3E97_11900 [Candidatus Eisenbacteria bacterium]
MLLRQRIIVVALLFAALLLFLSTLANGAWYRTQLTETVAPSARPHLVHDLSDAAHVFYEEGGEIRHLLVGNPVPEVLGTGEELDVEHCSVCGEISLAWIGTDDRPHFRSFADGVWSADSFQPSIFGPTVAVAVSHHGEGRLLWAEYDVMAENLAILFTWQNDGEWGPVIELGRGSVGDYFPNDTVLFLERIGADGELIASWVDTEVSATPGLRARTGKDASWHGVETVYDFFANDYAGDTAYPDGVTHFVGNGPQPTCPCNSLHYVSGSEGNWSAAENIGRDHYPAEMEWPQQMALHVRQSDGAPLVVWRHEAYQMLELVDERLVIGERVAGEWSFQYDLAIGRNAEDPDVSTDAAGHTFVVWSDDSQGAFDLYLATDREPSTLVTTDSADPGGLRVYPNPARVGAFVEWDAGLVQAPRLRMLDAFGREVCAHGLSSDSDCVRVWWELTDRVGRPLPNGVYLIELSDDVEPVKSTRVVVIR